MTEKFQDHLETKFSFLKGKRLLVACSGGLDSVVLSHLLYQANYEIGLAHCNFKLRNEESDEDEAFVKEFSKQMEVPFYAETFNTVKFAEETGVSIQMAARELRYIWFEEIRTDFKYDYILTAHHADDSLETLLINLSRGTGLRGLTGIPEVNNEIVRPLLKFSREEILNYAKAQNLFWREDSSNSKSDYFRNDLRHNVIPLLKQMTPSLLLNVLKTQSHLQDTKLLLDDYMMLVYKLAVTESEDGFAIDIEKLMELPNTNALLFEILRPFHFTAWEDISGLLTAQSGKQIYSQTHRLLKDREKLILTEISKNGDENSYWIDKDTSEIVHPILLNLESADHFEITNANTVFIDQKTIKFPLELRKWKEGDSFIPLGMKGKKKLSKFFKDEKLSLVAKESIWVLCSDQNIVWVVGQRPDERYKVTKDSTEILKIVYTPK
ncbi:MAG: tRNA lysidine(34) synthetase TilS [Flavobacteriaceae bacterium]|nr:tRNA lysidine(34) synthetase TilS [Flavobacteriaceae bacterium]